MYEVNKKLKKLRFFGIFKTFFFILTKFQKNVITSLKKTN